MSILKINSIKIIFHAFKAILFKFLTLTYGSVTIWISRVKGIAKSTRYLFADTTCLTALKWITNTFLYLLLFIALPWRIYVMPNFTGPKLEPETISWSNCFKTSFLWTESIQIRRYNFYFIFITNLFSNLLLVKIQNILHNIVLWTDFREQRGQMCTIVSFLCTRETSITNTFQIW